MKKIEFASLYEFSFLLFDNYKKARDWRMRVTDFEYMDHWKNWFGFNQPLSDLYILFQKYDIIIAYEPFTLPDWTRCIVGLMFYKVYTPIREFNKYHTIHFDERRNNDEIFFIKMLGKRTDLCFLKNNVFPVYPNFEKNMLKYFEYKYKLNLNTAIYIYKDYEGNIRTINNNKIIDNNINNLISGIKHEIQLGKTYVFQTN